MPNTLDFAVFFYRMDGMSKLKDPLNTNQQSRGGMILDTRHQRVTPLETWRDASGRRCVQAPEWMILTGELRVANRYPYSDRPDQHEMWLAGWEARRKLDSLPDIV